MTIRRIREAGESRTVGCRSPACNFSRKLCHNAQRMWNAFAHYFARMMTLVWFAGVIIMIATIPCCIYKIFSALWEPDDPEEHQAVTERPRR